MVVNPTKLQLAVLITPLPLRFIKECIKVVL